MKVFVENWANVWKMIAGEWKTNWLSLITLFHFLQADFTMIIRWDSWAIERATFHISNWPTISLVGCSNYFIDWTALVSFFFIVLFFLQTETEDKMLQNKLQFLLYSRVHRPKLTEQKGWEYYLFQIGKKLYKGDFRISEPLLVWDWDWSVQFRFLILPTPYWSFHWKTDLSPPPVEIR